MGPSSEQRLPDLDSGSRPRSHSRSPKQPSKESHRESKTAVLAETSNQNCGPTRGTNSGHRKLTFSKPRIEKGPQPQQSLRDGHQGMGPKGKKRCELLEASEKKGPPRKRTQGGPRNQPFGTGRATWANWGLQKPIAGVAPRMIL